MLSSFSPVQPLNPMFDLPQLQAALGQGRTSVYQRIGLGLIPKPLKPFGARKSVWPAHEIAQLQRAVIAGHSESQIKTLVASIEAARRGDEL